MQHMISTNAAYDIPMSTNAAYDWPSSTDGVWGSQHPPIKHMWPLIFPDPPTRCMKLLNVRVGVMILCMITSCDTNAEDAE